ncbi:MAG: FliM/FliN family flagellar motor switch protein [Myxococcota bacterium]
MMDESKRSSPLVAKVDRSVLGLIQDYYRMVARLARIRLVNRINGDLAVRYGTVEVASLGRVTDRLYGHEGGAFATFTLNPGGIPGCIVIQGPMLYRMVGLMLGEDPEAAPPLYHYRPLTPVDLRIAERVIEEILGALTEATQLTTEPSFTLEAVTANPRIRFNLPRGTTVVDASLDFGPPDDPYGLVSIIVPSQASGVLWPQRSESLRGDGAPTPEGVARVMPLPVDVVTELSRARLPFGKVKDLREGDVIDLGHLKDVTVRIGGKVAFTGEAGERDGMRSVRIKKKTTGEV